MDAPDNGFSIEGGKGYIVNVPEAKVVAFTGAAWANQPPVEAAPVVRRFNPRTTDGAWAFVVSGRFEEDSQTSEDLGSFYRVTVRNTRTNAVAADVVREGYFAAAFADVNRKNVVQIGDRLEVQVQDRTGEIVSDTFTYTVTGDIQVGDALNLGGFASGDYILWPDFPEDLAPVLLRLPVYSDPPFGATPEKTGYIYFDESSGHVYVCNGNVWVSLGN